MAGIDEYRGIQGVGIEVSLCQGYRCSGVRNRCPHVRDRGVPLNTAVQAGVNKCQQ